MLIKNALIFQENKCFSKGDILIQGERFEAPGTGNKNEGQEQVMDATGFYAIPGLVDIHFHGCMGADVCDAGEDTLETIARFEASKGITSMCPATMTVSKSNLFRVMEIAAAYESREGAKLAGLNMEGPFISEKKKGAQAAEHILNTDARLLYEFYEKSNHLVKMVDIAPEKPGAMDFIRKVKGKVIVSIAHTEADYDTALEAFEEGASHVTHLYNAMPQLIHRAPGVIGAAMDNPGVNVELICDGVHLHPAVVRASFKLFGGERIVLVSDSMRACGLSDGEYTLGGQQVFVKGKTAALVDGTIAGSVTNLFDCMKTAVKDMHIRLEDAIASATMNPAKIIGIFDQTGSISPGKYADLVLMDKSLNIKAVFINGKLVEGTIPR